MTENKNQRVGGLLLAAGGSSRFGRPKQLFEFEGKTLIRRAAESLAASLCDPVVVVLGAESHISQTEIADLDVTVHINNDWQLGMSSSIKSGLKQLLAIEPTLAAVVITVCDQPNITSADIDALANQFHSQGLPIIAAEYSETVGVPALFSCKLFDDLSRLEGDKGARHLIRNSLDQVRKIKMKAAAFDIDTPTDAQNTRQF